MSPKGHKEPWEVVVKLESRRSARELAARTASRHRTPTVRWRRVTFRCADRGAAQKLAARLESEVPPGTPIDLRPAPVGGGPWFGSGAGDGGNGDRHHDSDNGGGDGGGGGGNGGGGNGG